ncbi:FecR family protein [Chitinophaga sp. Hz27]|uniref:FecR family protein n=1 Tax=Chitinophaga sp. Hz27 TaxID=3347169 RepID=UPI0035E03724
MHESSTYYKDLLSRFIRNETAPAEVAELFAFIENEPEEYKELLNEAEILALTEKVALDSAIKFSDQDVNSVWEQVLLHTGRQQSGDKALSHGVHLLGRKWVKYAAAILLMVGIATGIYLSQHQRNKNLAANNEIKRKDMLPGMNNAVLALDDRSIDLASNKKGITVSSAIAYTDGEKLPVSGKKLKLTTPNGGQYQLVLPDGSKAWLNAASSISFPSAFEDDKRLVKITGEVYLEVSKDQSRPFLVDVDGKSTVEVLGTSFNINSYANEGVIKATVIEGSVRVGVSDSSLLDRHESAIGRQEKTVLKPGQQAIITTILPADYQPKDGRTDGSNKIAVLSDVDLSQTLAWKNGLFSFNNADIRTVMRQLERWYDIKVNYEGKDSGITISGKMYRNVSLSSILEFLRESGIRFRMENNTLVVL